MGWEGVRKVNWTPRAPWLEWQRISEVIIWTGCEANNKQYTAAVKTSSLDSVAKAISSLNEVYHKDPKLATIMEAPTLSAEDKSQIVAELQKHTGGADKEGTVKNFLSTLADYNRLGLLKGVCEKFADLISAAKGEVELTVTSASVSGTCAIGY